MVGSGQVVGVLNGVNAQKVIGNAVLTESWYGPVWAGFTRRGADGRSFHGVAVMPPVEFLGSVCASTKPANWQARTINEIANAKFIFFMACLSMI